jgi:hypothetical protein
MGLVRQGQTASFRALRRRRRPVSLLAALVIFLGAIIPFWHAARLPAPDMFDSAGLLALLGEQPDTLSAAICHHEEDGSSELPRGDRSRPGKNHCPLCLALQLHAPAVAPQGFSWAAFSARSVSASLSQRTEVTADHRPPEQGRPRAPPLA